MHINDFTTPCPIDKYVDDSIIFEVCAPGSQSRLQEAADAALTWSQQNDMRIKASKTHELLINFSRNGEHPIITTHHTAYYLGTAKDTKITKPHTTNHLQTR